MHVYAMKRPRAALLTGLAALAFAAPAVAVPANRPHARIVGSRAYAWQFNPSAAVGSWYSLAGSYSYNSSGLGNYARHDGTGRYTVRFRGVGSGGTVTTTAYGAGTRYCNIGYWVSDGGGG